MIPFRRSNVAENRSEEHSVAGNLIFAFDLGSSVIRLTAAQVDDNGTVHIMGYRQKESQGIKVGSVVDINALSITLSDLTREFEEAYSVHISKCIVGVPGCFIVSSNQVGSATVKNGWSVSADVQEDAIENACSGAQFNDSDYVRLHTILQNYITENSSEIINPIGQFAKRLDVKVHVVALKRSHEKNVSNVFENLRSELGSPSFIYTGIAAADAVLTESQKELGVCLVDIGAGTTNVAVYDNRKLMITFGIDRGGDGITQQISKTFGLPKYYAEEMKKQLGSATISNLTEKELASNITVNIGDEDHPQNITVRTTELANCINKYLLDIFRLVVDRISRTANEKKMSLNLAAGFVITGGVAKTRDIENLLLEQGMNPYSSGNLISKIHVGFPRAVELNDMSGNALDPEEMFSPDKAVSVGMMRLYWRDMKMQQMHEEEELPEPTGFMGKVMNVFRKIGKEF